MGYFFGGGGGGKLSTNSGEDLLLMGVDHGTLRSWDRVIGSTSLQACSKGTKDGFHR